MDKPAQTYISSRVSDNLFIIGSPLIALLSIVLICKTRAASGRFLYDPETPQWFIILSTTLTQAHIMMVYYRSHGNADVFRRFRYRFTLVPVLLLAAVWFSSVLFGVLAFIALYWDEWHSLMQTFGFGRIYDARLGNDPTIGRKLDMGLCFVLGLLPHVILITAIPLGDRSEGLQTFLDFPPEFAENWGHIIAAFHEPLIYFGIGYVLFYFLRYSRLIKNGYQYSKNKLILFACTGLSAITIASLYTVADAAYFGNIYHALQYFFIVTISEGPRLSKLTFPKRNLSLLLIGSLMLTVATALAVARHATEGLTFLGGFWLLTSLMHFWYDGFIWSVRKKDV